MKECYRLPDHSEFFFTQMVDANRKWGIKDLNCPMPKKDIKWLNEYVS